MIQWKYTDSNQSDLARHVIDLCGHPLTDVVLQTARKQLVHLRDKAVFDGYGTDDALNVHAQVAAIYRACLDDLNISLSLEPQDRFSVPLGQLVRDIDEMLAIRVANCIEIATMCAALLIKVGLNPFIVLLDPLGGDIPTHALLGYWTRDVAIDDVRIEWKDLQEHLADMAVVEITRLLRPVQDQRRFESASAEALNYLRANEQRKIARSPGVVPDSASSAMTPATMFYIIDIRSQLLSLERELPSIAIIGTRGGVGKTSLAARIAELVAESNHNVVVVDLDVHNEGSTIFHQSRRVGPQPRYQTLYDHVARYTHHKAEALGWAESESLWDVTPPFLRRESCGRVFLIAAQPPGALDYPDLLHGISQDTPTRNRKLQHIIADVRRRVTAFEVRIHCLVLDCGAGLEPFYASALRNAKYPFVVANPEPVSLQNLVKLKNQLAERSGENAVELGLIINRARGERDLADPRNVWSGFNPVAVIPEDPEFQKDYYASGVYFDLGYDVMSAELVRALQSRLRGYDARFVPDEADLWLRPWLARLRTPERHKALRRDRFWLKWIASGVVPMCALLVYIGSVRTMPAYSGTSYETKERIFIIRDVLGEGSKNDATRTNATEGGSQQPTSDDIVREFRRRGYQPVPTHESVDALLSVSSASNAQRKQFVYGLRLSASIFGMAFGLPWFAYRDTKRRLLREVLKRTDVAYALELLKEFKAASAPGWFQVVFGEKTSLDWPRRSASKWLRDLIQRERGVERERRGDRRAPPVRM